MRIGNIPFQIIGVLQRKGQSPMGTDEDDTVIIPISTYRSKIEGGLQQFIRGVILVSAVSRDATGRTGWCGTRTTGSS